MTKFELAHSIDLKQARSEIDFDVFREEVFTEDADRVNKKAMTRMTTEGKKILGLVSPRREVMPYTDIMDWVIEEFDKTGPRFKLQESSLVSKSDNLFQQYLFDLDVETPDNQDVSAMLILKGSHIGTPLKIEMGTYRFVCSNGVTVGSTFDTISLKARDLNSLLDYNLKDEISRGMNGMVRVAARYKELGNEDMVEYLLTLLNDPVFPVALKKSMIEMLNFKGTTEGIMQRTVKNSDFLTMRLDGNTIVNGLSEPVSEIISPISAWGLYNNATEIATHQTRNATGRDYYYKAISKLFAA